MCADILNESKSECTTWENAALMAVHQEMKFFIEYDGMRIPLYSSGWHPVKSSEVKETQNDTSSYDNGIN